MSVGFPFSPNPIFFLSSFFCSGAQTLQEGIWGATFHPLDDNLLITHGKGHLAFWHRRKDGFFEKTDIIKPVSVLLFCWNGSFHRKGHLIELTSHRIMVLTFCTRILEIVRDQESDHLMKGQFRWNDSFGEMALRQNDPFGEMTNILSKLVEKR